MIFANSFPKSGTGLLRQVLKPFGPDNMHFGMFDRVTGELRSHLAVFNTLNILRNQDGFVTCHLHWDPGYEHLILPDHKMIMLIRDPREIIVSHVKYVRAMPDHNLHEYFMSFDEEHCYFLSMAGIEGTLPNLADRFLPYLGWLKGHFHPDVLTISYQILVEMPTNACAKIAFHLEPERFKKDKEFRETIVGRMLAGIDPEKSNTYRPGDCKRWQDEMPEKAQEYFAEHFTWLLRLMNSKMYL